MYNKNLYSNIKLQTYNYAQLSPSTWADQRSCQGDIIVVVVTLWQIRQ